MAQVGLAALEVVWDEKYCRGDGKAPLSAAVFINDRAVGTAIEGKSLPILLTEEPQEIVLDDPATGGYRFRASRRDVKTGRLQVEIPYGSRFLEAPKPVVTALHAGTAGAIDSMEMQVLDPWGHAVDLERLESLSLAGQINGIAVDLWSIGRWDAVSNSLTLQAADLPGGALRIGDRIPVLISATGAHNIMMSSERTLTVQRPSSAARRPS